MFVVSQTIDDDVTTTNVALLLEENPALAGKLCLSS